MNFLPVLYSTLSHSLVILFRPTLRSHPGLLWSHGAGPLQTHLKHSGEDQWRARRQVTFLSEQSWWGRRWGWPTGRKSPMDNGMGNGPLMEQKELRMAVYKILCVCVIFFFLSDRECWCKLFKNFVNALASINVGLTCLQFTFPAPIRWVTSLELF